MARTRVKNTQQIRTHSNHKPSAYKVSINLYRKNRLDLETKIAIKVAYRYFSLNKYVSLHVHLRSQFANSNTTFLILIDRGNESQDIKKLKKCILFSQAMLLFGHYPVIIIKVYVDQI